MAKKFLGKFQRFPWSLHSWELMKTPIAANIEEVFKNVCGRAL